MIYILQNNVFNFPTIDQQVNEMEILASVSDIFKEHVNDFSFSLEKYNIYRPSELGLSGDDSNLILFKGEPATGVNIVFSDESKNCRVFVGEKTTGVGFLISIVASDCIIYIGDRCSFKKGSIVVCGTGDTVIVGNDVTTMPGNQWTTGRHSLVSGKMIVIGDDCMFASSVTIRASDGHPVFMPDTGKQINEPRNPIIIEPHCWIGERAIILKNVNLGACSIVAAGAVVTKSAPKFSLMAGVPASKKSLNGAVWSRSQREKDKEKSLMWHQKYGDVNNA